MEGIFQRSGVKIPKQSMWDMLVRVDELVSKPILAQMHTELLEEPILHSDETSVSLCIEGQKNSQTSWVWGWRSVAGAGPAKVLIQFLESRSREGPRSFLGEWKGILITDGYAAYESVCRENRIVRAGCWSHARRKFKEAFDTGSREAAPVLALIGRLFAVERAIKERAERQGLEHAQRLELRSSVRARTSKRLLARIYAEIAELGSRPSTLPKSKLGKAVGYATNQRDALSVFVERSGVPIHNNDQELSLIHI